MQLIPYSLELAQPKESDRLSRHESGAVGKRLARRVLHRRFDAGRFRHQQSERYWGRIQFDGQREVSGNLRGG